MQTEMRENLKLALLGVISISLVIQTLMQLTGGSSEITVDEPGSNVAVTVPPLPNPIDPHSNHTQEPEPDDNTPKTAISFAQTSHDFGTIKQDSEHKKVFKFTNTGTNPLIIKSANGSCGCTVPKYPEEPIAPGKTGEIEVVYSPGQQEGQQSKTVTIVANTDPPTLVLDIKANVVPK